MRHLYKAVSCFTAIFLSSCSEVFDNTWTAGEMERSLSLTESSLSFTFEAQSKTLGVKAENVPWTLENSANWLTLSPVSGKGSSDITVKVQDNLSDEARTSHVYLKSTDVNFPRSYTLTITQSAQSAYVRPDKNSLIFDSGASEQQVIVTSNREWTYSASQSWISISRSENTLTISVSANLGNTTRDGYVNVTAGDINAQIQVTQAGVNGSFIFDEFGDDENWNE